MKFREKREEVTTTSTTYLRPTEVSFYLPEVNELIATAKEAKVTKGKKKTEEFTRAITLGMNADNKYTAFEVKKRNGDTVFDMTYVQLFWAVESFYQHMADLQDEV